VVEHIDETHHGAVAADGEENADPGLPEMPGRSIAPLGGVRLRTPPALQDRAPELQDVGDGRGVEDPHVGHRAGDAEEPSHDAHGLDAVVQSGSHDRAHCRVHTRRIAAACHDPDAHDYPSITDADPGYRAARRSLTYATYRRRPSRRSVSGRQPSMASARPAARAECCNSPSRAGSRMTSGSPPVNSAKWA